MRASTVDWIHHGNMPINSVDVQPRGYRILTGGNDNKVCIWNLLPILSRKYEARGNKTNEGRPDAQLNKSSGGNIHGKSAQNAAEERKIEIEIDGSSCQEANQKLDDDDPKNEAFKPDIEVMESLFEKEEIKSVRKLAELSNHEQPVNCVRWNSVGTFFASGGDDGRAILWEFKGHKFVSKSQDIFNNAYGGGDGLPISQEDFKNQEQNADNDKVEVREDWQAKKIWRNHQSITDLTWAPDSLHFATCGTDSRICIMNINEGAPLKILDSKANGLTFDPFGKFLASQSSEEKCVKIWRVQNFKNITEATQISSYFKQAMGMSINRRLSWSSDGSFISATGGRIAGEYVVPLIERSSWNLMACLSGHSSSINISRINQKLYKYAGGSDLNCYSIVAIVSQDSTISVWKPQLEKPFALIMDFSMMGVTDLSWGFNGNILFSSSHDGKVSAFHFEPGILGEPLSEFEKREIIQRRYGNQVLQDYIKNASTTSQQKSDMNQLSANTQSQQPVRQQQTTTVNAITGKKKIQPKIERIFDDTNAKVNPHLNPFMQLNEACTKPSFSKPLNGSAVKHTQNQQLANDKEMKPVDDAAASNKKLPTMNEIAKLQQQNQATVISQNLAQNVVVAQNPTIQNQANTINGSSNSLLQQQEASKPQVPQQRPTPEETNAFAQAKPLAPSVTMQQAQEALTQKQSQIAVASKPLLSLGASAAIMTQLQNQNKLAQQNGTASSGQPEDNSRRAEEFMATLQSIYETNNELTAIPLSLYQSLFQELMRDEIQLVLPQDNQDMFSEEIRVIIQNLQLSQHSQKIELKVYNSESAELSHLDLQGERVLLMTANRNFFALYTNKQQLHIFSSTTVELIKKGIVIEGACMIESSQSQNLVALLTLRGTIYIYRVLNPDYPNIDSVRLEYSTSVQHILRNCQLLRTKGLGEDNMSKALDKSSKDACSQLVHVQSLKLNDSGKIEVYLSNQEKYQYDHQYLKQWKQMPLLAGDQPLKQQESQNANDAFVEPALLQFEGSINQDAVNQQMAATNKQNQKENLSSLIELLNQNSITEVQDRNAQMQVKNSVADKLMQQQDMIQMYENLGLRNEFLNTLRNFTLSVFTAGDLNKIKELFVKFGYLEITKKSDDKKSTVNEAESVAGLLGYLDENTCKQEGIDMGTYQDIQLKKRMKARVIIVGDKKYCGYEKSQIFKHCILPVLKTICQDQPINILDLIQQVVQQIAQADGPAQESNNDEQNDNSLPNIVAQQQLQADDLNQVQGNQIGMNLRKEQQQVEQDMMLQESLNNLKNATLQGGGLQAKFQNQPPIQQQHTFNDESLIQRQLNVDGSRNSYGIPMQRNDNFSSPYQKIPLQLQGQAPYVVNSHEDFSHQDGTQGMLALQQAQQQQMLIQQRAQAQALEQAQAAGISQRHNNLQNAELEQLCQLQQNPRNLPENMGPEELQSLLSKLQQMQQPR